MKPKRSGQPTGVTGVITADQQRAALGIATEQPREGRVPLSPRQQRLLEEDKWPGEPPEDYEATIVTGAELFGIESLPTPPNYRDGDPIPQVPKPRERPVGTDWSKLDAPSPEAITPSSQPLTAEAANELRAQYREHCAKITAMAEAARGDAAKEARAAEEVRASAELGERLKTKLGGVL